MLPHVIVCMAAYNAEAWIGEAIESIRHQTYGGAITLIIADDASTDGTFKAIEDATRPDAIPVEMPRESKSQTHIIRADRNVGPGMNHNRCFELMLKLIDEPSIIAIQAADDISKPDRIAKSVDYLLEHPGMGIVSCSLKFFGDQQGDFRAARYAPPTPGVVAWDWVYRQVGMHPDHGSHDRLWCEKAGVQGIEWGLIDEHLYMYRRHPMQHSTLKLLKRDD